VDLETLLTQLAGLTPEAQRRYQTERREAGEEETDEHVWLELQHDNSYGGSAWQCGYAYLAADSATDLFIRAYGRTPTEAAKSLLALMEPGQQTRPEDMLHDRDWTEGDRYAGEVDL
jgi:hypothetical protein